MKTAEVHRIDFPTFFTRSPDGTRIRYFDTGPPQSCSAHNDPQVREDAPVIVLANGLGGPRSAWFPYISRWKEQYRVIAWDYRGLYGSLLARRDADLSVEAHATDVLSILDAANVQTAHFLGWSMGVQVGLEFYSTNKNRLESLILLNGTFGRPLRGVPLPFSELALTPLVRGAGRLHRVGSGLLKRVTQTPLSYHALRSTGVIAKGLPFDRFHQMMNDFKTIDLHVYFDLLACLGRHDAESQLSQVQVPTLVITGSRDVLTPPSLARKIANDIPKAQLFVIPGATHYAAAEYPEVVAERVEQFLQKAQTQGLLVTSQVAPLQTINSAQLESSSEV